MPKAPIPDRFEGKPVLTAAQMKALDTQAEARFGLAVETLMENAGRAVAAEVSRFLTDAGKRVESSKLVVCCGRGANGGDGLVAARYLKEKGAQLAVFICPAKKDATGPGSYPPLVQKNLELAKAKGVAVAEAGEGSGLAAALAGCDAVIDALLGTGSAGKPAGAIHHMIQEITRSKKPVLAVDIPSGIHPDTGYHSGVFITAAQTYTLGAAKKGLLAAHAQKNVGVLKVLDIGYPAEALA